jgi:membrane associated rhomboid family serine protease
MFPIRDTIPSRRAPVVLWLIVLANAAVFAYRLSLSRRTRAALRPLRHRAAPLGGADRGERAHASLDTRAALLLDVLRWWLHVIRNLDALDLRNNVGDRMRSGRFLLFYVVCGVAARSRTATQVRYCHVGASGAIAG